MKLFFSTGKQTVENFFKHSTNCISYRSCMQQSFGRGNAATTDDTKVLRVFLNSINYEFVCLFFLCMYL
jgi:hypothetical protein